MNTLFRVTDKRVQALPQTTQPRYTDTPNRYSPNEEHATLATKGLGDVPSVRSIAPDVWSVVSHVPQRESEPLPTDFREVLRSWEHT